MGGFGSAVLEALAAAGIKDVQITNLGIPDELLSTPAPYVSAMPMRLSARHRQCCNSYQSSVVSKIGISSSSDRNSKQKRCDLDENPIKPLI